MRSRCIVSILCLVFLQFLFCIYADAGYIDLLECDKKEAPLIMKHLGSAAKLLETAAYRLEALHDLLYPTEDFEKKIKPKPIDPKDLTPRDASTLHTYHALIGNYLDKVISTSDAPKRIILVERISFHARLAMQLSRGLSQIQRLTAEEKSQNGNARPIQFSCGDEWLAPIPKRPKKYADKRPGAQIAYSEKQYQRQIVEIEDRMGYMGLSIPGIDESPNIIQGFKPSWYYSNHKVLPINDLAGPYQSVIILRRNLFKGWTVGRPEKDLDFQEMKEKCQKDPNNCPDRTWHAQYWFQHHMEMALIFGAALSPVMTINDVVYDATGGGSEWQIWMKENGITENKNVPKDGVGRRLWPLRPLTQLPGSDATDVGSWLSATGRAKKDPEKTQFAVENFMYLVVALGLDQFDWSTGYNRKLESTQTSLGVRRPYPPGDHRPWANMNSVGTLDSDDDDEAEQEEEPEDVSMDDGTNTERPQNQSEDDSEGSEEDSGD